MSKQCNVCHQSYSDELKACPHCKTAHADAGSGDIDEETWT